METKGKESFLPQSNMVFENWGCIGNTAKILCF